MKTLTVTINAPAQQQPVDVPGAFAGFKLTLLRGGQSLSPPVSQELIWTFGDLGEGESLTLTIQSVDTAGVVMVALPAMVLTVPGTGTTYLHLTSADVAWS